MPTTLQDVTNRITSDYLNRSDMNAPSIRAVQAAIRHYEKKRFPWNETVATLTTAASQSYISLPTDFLILDMLELQYQGNNYELIPESLQKIKEMNAAATANLPTHFVLYGGKFELAVIPDSAYAVNCYYIKRLTELSSVSMGASNKWLSAAEDLIVYHATKIVWANVLRNDSEAAKYAQLERDAYNKITSYTEQQLNFGITPTEF